ncbi:MAG: energy transducer TonB [Gammaproteobacteria bacterium]|jgi:protein TonB|nr:energy transducer TonB [Gammaproteobacteria bacterium]
MDGANSAGPLISMPNWAGNHLSSTMFLAALFHGVVIMGVTFTGADNPPVSDDATTLEVVLITGEYEKQQAPDDAQLLAERNLRGAGNASDVPVQIAYGRNYRPRMPGPEQDGDPEALDQGMLTPMMRVAVDTHNKDSRNKIPDDYHDQAQPKPALRGMPGAENPVEILAAPDSETLLPSTAPRELVISATTRESRIAAYLDSWKRKVERVGTMNFPHDISYRNLLKNPTLEVAIAADGTLEEVVVLTSSGERRLDQAAMEILILAAPFEAFPEFLHKDYDVLRFAYEWRFSGETTGRTNVTMAGES